MKEFFITGISTEVGKTITAAIITEALEADYWKPIQAGDLDNTDTHKVANLISNSKTVFHDSSYALKTPVSPHEAAAIEGITIDVNKIKEPKTTNNLVIEGAGGLLVPLNSHDTILDIIMPNHKIIVVSRHYLGSINHTLLTLKWLTGKGYDVYLVFSGDANPATEDIIVKKTGVPVIGRINEEPSFDKEVIKKYADLFRPILETL